MRTTTITIAIPAGARYMTTDKDGTVRFWMSQPESISKGQRWHNAGLRGITETFIPCDHWRDSLIDLDAEAEGK